MATDTFKIKVREIGGNDFLPDHHQTMENIIITAKNTDTLEEYQVRKYIEPDYLPKIQYWLEKHKFTCEETSPQTLHLNIDKLFDFNLEKTNRSDAETIRDELAELKREKQ